MLDARRPRESYIKESPNPAIIGQEYFTSVPLGRITEDQAVEIRVVAEGVQIVIMLGSDAEIRL